ncbi:MAG: dihydropteroate synthase [Planctomycetota bacterium]
MPHSVPAFTSDHRVHLVTGKLAEIATREAAANLSSHFGLSCSVGVMPITVAALMTPRWLMRHLSVPDQTTDVVVPGYLEPGVREIQNFLVKETGNPAIRLWIGPKDCRDLVTWATGKERDVDLSKYSVEIIAEINHAPRMTIQAVCQEAAALRACGADRIDLGCDPSRQCDVIGDYVSALRADGHAISIDSFDEREVSAAVKAGADLVLSVNSTNRHRAPAWGCEVVAIPDRPEDLSSLHETIAFLDQEAVPYRVDPILEPIGSGLMKSLIRYDAIRDLYPKARMMMGIGNLTELSDVDSAGVNFLLLGLCEELRVTSVLTTQVINWARNSVRECDIARRLMHHAIEQSVPPKNLSAELVCLRDARLKPASEAFLQGLGSTIKDHNYRILNSENEMHVLSSQVHLSGRDPFELFEQLTKNPAVENVDASHAFYLGYEMAKAATALQLGKQYEQDQALDWGHLTVPEDRHRVELTSRHRKHER